jgi:hypothetical protein
MITEVDGSGKGAVDFAEFMKMMSKNGTSTAAEIKETFALFNAGGSGMVSSESCCDASSLSYVLCRPLAPPPLCRTKYEIFVLGFCVTNVLWPLYSLALSFKPRSHAFTRLDPTLTLNGLGCSLFLFFLCSLLNAAADELAEILGKLGDPADAAACQEMIDLADVSKSGGVNFTDFELIMLD